MTPQYEQIDLVVPTGHVNCCPCPDHKTNYVGVAFDTSWVGLLGSLGLQDIRNSSNGSVDGRCDLTDFLMVAVDADGTRIGETPFGTDKCSPNNERSERI